MESDDRKIYEPCAEVLGLCLAYTKIQSQMDDIHQVIRQETYGQLLKLLGNSSGKKPALEKFIRCLYMTVSHQSFISIFELSRYARI